MSKNIKETQLEKAINEISYQDATIDMIRMGENDPEMAKIALKRVEKQTGTMPRDLDEALEILLNWL